MKNTNARMPKRLDTLSSVVKSYSKRGIKPEKRNICFTTEELPGLFQNGGAGTATLGLAFKLADAGHQITILYCADGDRESESAKNTLAELERAHIRIYFLGEVAKQGDWRSSYRKRSFAIYTWLKSQNFDIVHFLDFGGSAFDCCQAKKCGVAFQTTLLCIVTHGISRWGWEIMGQLLSDPGMLEVDFLERRSLELADYVLPPSKYLAEWIIDHGVKLPDTTFVQKNIMPPMLEREEVQAQSKQYPIREIVFFGRQEQRKGFHYFVDAIKLLHKKIGSHVQFTMLGKFSLVFGEHSACYLLENLQNIPNKIVFLPDFDRDKALSYLKRPGVLAVMPSVEENLPSVVYECVTEGINFIASGHGGTPELLDKQTQDSRLFFFGDPVDVKTASRSLADKLEDLITKPKPEARLSFEPEENTQTFQDWHSLVPIPSNPDKIDRPFISVILVHHDRPKLLKEALATLFEQTYTNFEIVLVDDGSKLPETEFLLEKYRKDTHPVPLKIIKTDDVFLGAARNAGVKEAAGDYFIFVDDDNVSKSNMVEMFATGVISSGADILSCPASVLIDSIGSDRVQAENVAYLPLGGAPASGLFSNCYGDSNSIVSRKVFDAVGGFAEERVGAEDWDLFTKATLNGFEHYFLPEVLYYYRDHTGRLTARPHNFRAYYTRIARQYLGTDHPALLDILYLAQGRSAAAHFEGQTSYFIYNRKFGALQQQMKSSVYDIRESKRLLVHLLILFGRPTEAHLLLDTFESLPAEFEYLKPKLNSGKAFSWLSRSQSSAVKLPDHVLKNAQHLNSGEFEDVGMHPLRYLEHKNALLVHPLRYRTSTVVLSYAIPPGVKEITSLVSVADDRGSKTEFTLAIGLAENTPNSGNTDYEDLFIHSKSIVVGPKNGQKKLSFDISKFSSSYMHLYLVTNSWKLHQSISYNDAIFEDICIVW